MERSGTRKTQIYIKEEQYRYLVREAKKTGSIAGVVRNLIDEKMRQPARREDSAFKLGSKSFGSKDKDISVNHDKYLYE